MKKYSRKDKLRIDILNTIEEAEHFHQDIELIYILQGTMKVVVGEQETYMKRGDILVINANKRYSFDASQDILFTRLSIIYQLISDVLQSKNIIFWCDSTRAESDRYDELRDVINQLLNHYSNNQGRVENFGHIAHCYKVMDILSIHFRVHASDKISVDKEDQFEERIQEINNYISANYSQSISLKDLSEELYLSDGYLSRFFKKNYGMSFSQYLSNIRLYHAVDELLYTNMPITRIAYDNGFANVAAFNKAFKEAYGETPSALRRKSKKHRETVEKKENDIVVKERLEDFLRKDGAIQEEKPVTNIRQEIYSVKDRVDIKYSWNRMINIGAAAELLKSGVREHIILLKEALGFEYVRFWNIFSKELLIDIAREDEEYNFSKLDSILDFLIQHGIKPHIELGMKPKRIFRTVQKLVLEDTGDTEFMGMEDWSRVLDTLMKHLVGRYGRSELDSWRMELWFNESKWDIEIAGKEYYELFNLTYEIIKKYSKGIEIGGCGLRIDYLEKTGQKFLQDWKLQRHQPDYLSIIYFGYERGEIDNDRYSKRDTDNEGMFHRISAAKSILEKVGMEDMKIYVTEWNLTISDRNHINDTCFKGAYVVKNLLDTYGLVDETSYFLGSDRISEYYDSNAMLHGGTGLISKDGILKPAGFAFEFLNRLYPYYIGKGSNHLITTDGHNSYGIICHNQKVLNYNYYFSQEDAIGKEHIWKYFEERDTLGLTLKLADVEDGNYQLKIYRINECNGSVLNIWEDMKFEKDLSRNDIKYFRRVCEPKLTIEKYEVKNGTLDVNIQLDSNEIAFVRARKLI